MLLAAPLLTSTIRRHAQSKTAQTCSAVTGAVFARSSASSTRLRQAVSAPSKSRPWVADSSA
jgi:hypothetical protein